MHVRGDQSDLQSLLVEIAAQLPGAGGLSLTIKADHQDDLFGQGKRALLSQDLDQLVEDDLDDMLPAGLAGGWLLGERPSLHLLGELQDQLDIDVRLQERPLNVLGDLLDELLVHVAGVSDLLEDVP
jgi:hypothetical protein